MLSLLASPLRIVSPTKHQQHQHKEEELSPPQPTSSVIIPKPHKSRIPKPKVQYDHERYASPVRSPVKNQNTESITKRNLRLHLNSGETMKEYDKGKDEAKNKARRKNPGNNTNNMNNPDLHEIRQSLKKKVIEKARQSLNVRVQSANNNKNSSGNEKERRLSLSLSRNGRGVSAGSNSDRYDRSKSMIVTSNDGMIMKSKSNRLRKVVADAMCANYNSYAAETTSSSNCSARSSEDNKIAMDPPPPLLKQSQAVVIDDNDTDKKKRQLAARRVRTKILDMRRSSDSESLALSSSKSLKLKYREEEKRKIERKRSEIYSVNKLMREAFEGKYKEFGRVMKIQVGLRKAEKEDGAEENYGVMIGGGLGV